MQTIIETLSGEPALLVGTILGALGILGGATIAVSAIISDSWRKVRQVEELNAIKMQMLERGMTAEDIVKVISASPRRKWQEHVIKAWGQWDGCSHGKRARQAAV